MKFIIFILLIAVLSVDCSINRLLTASCNTGYYPTSSGCVILPTTIADVTVSITYTQNSDGTLPFVATVVDTTLSFDIISKINTYITNYGPAICGTTCTSNILTMLNTNVVTMTFTGDLSLLSSTNQVFTMSGSINAGNYISSFTGVQSNSALSISFINEFQNVVIDGINNAFLSMVVNCSTATSGYTPSQTSCLFLSSQSTFYANTIIVSDLTACTGVNYLCVRGSTDISSMISNAPAFTFVFTVKSGVSSVVLISSNTQVTYFSNVLTWFGSSSPSLYSTIQIESITNLPMILNNLVISFSPYMLYFTGNINGDSVQKGVTLYLSQSPSFFGNYGESLLSSIFSNAYGLSFFSISSVQLFSTSTDVSAITFPSSMVSPTYTSVGDAISVGVSFAVPTDTSFAPLNSLLVFFASITKAISPLTAQISISAQVLAFTLSIPNIPITRNLAYTGQFFMNADTGGGKDVDSLNIGFSGTITYTGSKGQQVPFTLAISVADTPGFGYTFFIQLSSGQWVDPFGVVGLTLTDLVGSLTLMPEEPWFQACSFTGGAYIGPIKRYVAISFDTWDYTDNYFAIALANFTFGEIATLCGITLPNSFAATGINSGTFSFSTSLNDLAVPSGFTVSSIPPGFQSVANVNLFGFQVYYQLIIGQDFSFQLTFSPIFLGSAFSITNSDGTFGPIFSFGDSSDMSQPAVTSVGVKVDLFGHQFIESISTSSTLNNGALGIPIPANMLGGFCTGININFDNDAVSFALTFQLISLFHLVTIAADSGMTVPTSYQTSNIEDFTAPSLTISGYVLFSLFGKTYRYLSASITFGPTLLKLSMPVSLFFLPGQMGFIYTSSGTPSLNLEYVLEPINLNNVFKMTRSSTSNDGPILEIGCAIIEENPIISFLGDIYVSCPFFEDSITASLNSTSSGFDFSLSGQITFLSLFDATVDLAVELNDPTSSVFFKVDVPLDFTKSSIATSLNWLKNSVSSITGSVENGALSLSSSFVSSISLSSADDDYSLSFSNVQIEVFLVYNSSLSDYSEILYTCSNFNAVPASSVDVSNAFNLGGYWSQAGYVSDFIIPFPNLNVFDISMQYKFYVNCVGPKPVSGSAGVTAFNTNSNTWNMNSQDLAAKSTIASYYNIDAVETTQQDVCSSGTLVGSNKLYTIKQCLGFGGYLTSPQPSTFYSEVSCFSSVPTEFTAGDNTVMTLDTALDCATSCVQFSYFLYQQNNKNCYCGSVAPSSESTTECAANTFGFYNTNQIGLCGREGYSDDYFSVNCGICSLSSSPNCGQPWANPNTNPANLVTLASQSSLQSASKSLRSKLLRLPSWMRHIVHVIVHTSTSTIGKVVQTATSTVGKITNSVMQATTTIAGLAVIVSDVTTGAVNAGQFISGYVTQAGDTVKDGIVYSSNGAIAAGQYINGAITEAGDTVDSTGNIITSSGFARLQTMSGYLYQPFNAAINAGMKLGDLGKTVGSLNYAILSNGLLRAGSTFVSSIDSGINYVSAVGDSIISDSLYDAYKLSYDAKRLINDGLNTVIDDATSFVDTLISDFTSGNVKFSLSFSGDFANTSVDVQFSLSYDIFGNSGTVSYSVNASTFINNPQSVITDTINRLLTNVLKEVKPAFGKLIN